MRRLGKAERDAMRVWAKQGEENMRLMGVEGELTLSKNIDRLLDDLDEAEAENERLQTGVTEILDKFNEDVRVMAPGAFLWRLDQCLGDSEHR
jgi:hypothetical protein